MIRLLVSVVVFLKSQSEKENEAEEKEATI